MCQIILQLRFFVIGSHRELINLFIIEVQPS